MKTIITALAITVFLTACGAEQVNSKPSDAELLTTCQMAIQPQLKNPKSMEIDYRQTAISGTNDGQFAVKMYYYAENGFGATPLSAVNCVLDKDGVLLEYQQTQ